MPEQQEGNGTTATIGSQSEGNNGATGGTEAAANNGSATGNNLGWKAGLPADLRDHDAFRDMGKPGDLASAYLEAQQKLSRSIVKPGENANDAEVAEYRKAIGVPEGPDKYEFSTPSEDEGFDKTIRSIAHEQGLTAAQADKLHKGLIEHSQGLMSETQKKTREARDAATEKLRQEWGASYAANDAAARRFAAIAGADLTDALTQSGLIDDPRVIKGLHKFATMISEDHLVSGRGQQHTGSSTWSFPNTPGM